MRIFVVTVLLFFGNASFAGVQEGDKVIYRTYFYSQGPSGWESEYITPITRGYGFQYGMFYEFRPGDGNTKPVSAPEWLMGQKSTREYCADLSVDYKTQIETVLFKNQVIEVCRYEWDNEKSTGVVWMSSDVPFDIWRSEIITKTGNIVKEVTVPEFR